MIAAGLSGRDGGQTVTLANPLVIVPLTVIAPVQKMYIMQGLMQCKAIEIEMGLASKVQ